jgi:hypothetical protein
VLVKRSKRSCGGDMRDSKATRRQSGRVVFKWAEEVRLRWSPTAAPPAKRADIEGAALKIPSSSGKGGGNQTRPGIFARLHCW